MARRRRVLDRRGAARPAHRRGRRGEGVRDDGLADRLGRSRRRAVSAAMRALQSHTTSNAAAVSQHAALAALSDTRAAEPAIEAMVAEFRARRNAVVAEMRTAPAARVRVPWRARSICSRDRDPRARRRRRRVRRGAAGEARDRDRAGRGILHAGLGAALVRCAAGAGDRWSAGNDRTIRLATRTGVKAFGTAACERPSRDGRASPRW